MRIESLSIKTVTVAIYVMVGISSVLLSLLASSYFKQAALDAQIKSLSRVIEVASQEVIREISGHAFDLGMKLGHNAQLIEALQFPHDKEKVSNIVEVLNDPFISGFAGFAEINLVRLRVYSLDLELLVQSDAGEKQLENHLPPYLATQLVQRKKIDRLKAVDALWTSPVGPLFSTLVPVGGLRAVGYLEVVVDPAFNLPEISRITKTPVKIFNISDINPGSEAVVDNENHLPVAYTLQTSAGRPVFRIVGYEDVSVLLEEMGLTQVITTGGFILLTLTILLMALWMFNRFLFVPMDRLVEGMRQVADWKRDIHVSKRGLLEFATLAQGFESMAGQIRIRNNELERLLDLDDSAILCFGEEGEAIYFNRAAQKLFYYSEEEISQLDLVDLFPHLETLGEMVAGAPSDQPHHQRLECLTKDGRRFEADAAINLMQISGGLRQTIVMRPLSGEEGEKLTEYLVSSIEQNEHRIKAVEQSLGTILELARMGPGHRIGSSKDSHPVNGSENDAEKQLVKERVVQVMHASLACWERDLGKSKLELAEESGIWPVYIDKSTPTTRTLDRYLHVDSCPKNPRSKRVIDTAEFVLKCMNRKSSHMRTRLQQSLDELRLLLSGLNGNPR
ncbi:MAG: PAS domain-containing protein [Candidatus Thiodiazotropha sp. (ex Myrtea spinifera)]|nr:PAS domain-containing protein [Candidatus Thiodiazotropha sp. (ex Myrtea spinifera)]MCU7827998.1 PAS domain-containing protein [Candidatus Thiodiazotropha sp. (ex Myrtea sp. 'scaly one' KF741663)]